MILSVVAFLSLMSASVASGATPETEFDAAAAAAGRGIYNAHCASCHGVDAKGNGEVAQYLTVKPADLTRLRYAHAGEYPLNVVMEAIDGRQRVKTHGTRQMPIWGAAFQSVEGGKTKEEAQEMVYRVAQYLWSIQK
jgi:mono/diheme cytochrome c family protein